MSRKPHLVRHPRILLGGGQPSDRSYRRGGEERRRKKHLNWQILPAAPRVRAAVSPGPSGPCLPSSASWSLPAPPLYPSLPHAAAIFFFLLPCTSFLHVALSSSLSPSFRSSLSQPCSLWLFYPSPSLSVRLPATIFTFLTLCPVARWYFCCLWLSLSGSLSLLFKVFLLGSVAHHESISFSVSLYPAPCPSF